MDKKVKPQQQQKTKSNIKILAKAGNRTWDLLPQRRMLYLSATESTERLDLSQAI